jgi:hypothetical protein
VKRGYGIRDYPYTADVGPWTLFSAAVDTIILTCPSLRLTTIGDLLVHAGSGKDAVGFACRTLERGNDETHLAG